MTCGSCKIKIPSFQKLREHWRMDCPQTRDWRRVAELRAAGQDATADRISRRLLGVRGPEMDGETKAKLRAYREEHKDEIRLRAKIKRAGRKRLKALAGPRRRR